MILIRKLAPKRLTRAIVTLAAKSGNKLMRTKDNKMADGREEFSRPTNTRAGCLKQSKRTTITVTTETERLLIVKRSSLAPEGPDVYSSRKK